MLTTLDTQLYQHSLLSPLMSPIFNRMSHCCLQVQPWQGCSATLQVCSLLYFPLWNYIVSFTSVWVLHNAACSGENRVCLFKWQLYPQGLPALCMFWLCVHWCCLYKCHPLFSSNYWIPFLYWYGRTQNWYQWETSSNATRTDKANTSALSFLSQFVLYLKLSQF